MGSVVRPPCGLRQTQSEAQFDRAAIRLLSKPGFERANVRNDIDERSERSLDSGVDSGPNLHSGPNLLELFKKNLKNSEAVAVPPEDLAKKYFEVIEMQITVARNSLDVARKAICRGTAKLLAGKSTPWGDSTLVPQDWSEKRENELAELKCGATDAGAQRIMLQIATESKSMLAMQMAKTIAADADTAALKRTVAEQAMQLDAAHARADGAAERYAQLGAKLAAAEARLAEVGARHNMCCESPHGWVAELVRETNSTGTAERVSAAVVAQLQVDLGIAQDQVDLLVSHLASAMAHVKYSDSESPGSASAVTIELDELKKKLKDLCAVRSNDANGMLEDLHPRYNSDRLRFEQMISAAAADLKGAKAHFDSELACMKSKVQAAIAERDQVRFENEHLKARCKLRRSSLRAAAAHHRTQAVSGDSDTTDTPDSESESFVNKWVAQSDADSRFEDSSDTSDTPVSLEDATSQCSDGTGIYKKSLTVSI